MRTKIPEDVEHWLNEQTRAKLSRAHTLARSYSSAKPFPHLILKDFLADDLPAALIQSLQEETFTEERSDLFTFIHSKDLQDSKTPLIHALAKTLSGPTFINFLEQVTGEKLQAGKLDLASSIYEDTDHLLCHDDQLQGRKVAFILYLTSLEKGDGGELTLYESKRGKPTKEAKKILPKENSFAFFTVSERSFHSVQEVLVDKQRITLQGWFYGKDQ